MSNDFLSFRIGKGFIAIQDQKFDDPVQITFSKEKTYSFSRESGASKRT